MEQTEDTIAAEKNQTVKSNFGRKRKAWVIVGVVCGLLFVGGLVGGLIYYYTSQANKSNSPPSTADPPSTDYSGNTTIMLDPRYTRSFWGMDYTPRGSQMDLGCTVTQDDVIEDLKILYQLTPRIRLYGMDCAQADLVLNGLNRLGIDMGVVLTLWVDDNQTTYQRQYDTFWKVTDTYGFDRLTGVSIGNEAIFRKQATVDNLVSKMDQMRSALADKGQTHIPVYTTEINDLDKLLPHEDALMDNVHPFFGGTTAETAANWTWKYYYEVDQYPTIQYAKTNNIQIPAVISEIGWPSFPPNGSVQGAIPGIPQLQRFMDDYVCEANRRGLPYYWFEFKDEPWKQWMFNETRESYWGLFDENRQLKNVSLPNCPMDIWTKGDLAVPQPLPLTTTH
ncbi:glycoside hydrolase superfamily [Umbelopsis sp. AD052]|nr:glycoside hydrolase superfamily [Umbelopsis sp. AD052]